MKYWISSLSIFVIMGSVSGAPQRDLRKDFYESIKDPARKKHVEKIEKEIIQKSKKIEAEMRESTAEHETAQEMFKFKDSITENKIILGEEVRTLKNAETLIKEFNVKKEKVIDAYRKEYPLHKAEITQINGSSVLYPVMASNDQIKNSDHQMGLRLKEKATEESNRKIILYVFLGILLTGTIILFIGSRRRNK